MKKEIMVWVILPVLFVGLLAGCLGSSSSSGGADAIVFANQPLPRVTGLDPAEVAGLDKVIALAAGIVWALNLVGLIIILAIHSLTNDPPEKSD